MNTPHTTTTRSTTISDILSPLMRTSFDMEMLGMGLVSFRAIYERPHPKFSAVLNDDTGRILHVLVPPLREYILKGVKGETVYELQKCIEQAALYTTDRTFLNQRSFVPLRTVQNVWLCIANALGLLHSAEDAEEVRQTLGRVLEEAYVGMIQKQSEVPLAMWQPFELRCTVIFLKKWPGTDTLSTEELVRILLRSPTMPAGVGELAEGCSWPEPVAVDYRREDTVVSGYHAPFAALSLGAHPAVSRVAVLCDYSDVGTILLDLGKKLSPDFSCQKLWGKTMEEVTLEMRKTFGIKE